MVFLLGYLSEESFEEREIDCIAKDVMKVQSRFVPLPSLARKRKGTVLKYSPLPFSPCASPTEANRSPQNPAGKLADCREVFILSREVFARVDFDFSFRIPRGRSFWVRAFCFIFLWSSIVLRFLFLRVPLLRKQTVPRRTPLGSWRIAERFLF